MAEAQSIMAAFASSLSNSMSAAQVSMKKSESAFDDFKGMVEKMTLGLAAAAAAISGYLVTVDKQAADFGAEIQRAAGDASASFQQMSQLKPFADRAGLGLDDLGKSFQTMQQKAREGDAATVAALKAISLTAADVANLTETQLAVKMAGAFSRVRDSAFKAQAGVALFGADAGRIVAGLSRGPEVLANFEAAAHRAGTAIGPDLQAALAGTNELFQQTGDHMAELRATFDGLMLQSFAAFKPAADGLVQVINDLVGNVTAAIEDFNGLTGAGEHAATSTGILADAAKSFTAAIIDASAWAQEFGARVYQVVADMGIRFVGLSRVVQGFAADLETAMSRAAQFLASAFHAAIAAVARELGDFAEAAKAALTFDVAGAKAALADIAAAHGAMVGQIKEASRNVYSDETIAAWDRMKSDLRDQDSAIDGVIKRLEAQKRAQEDLVAAGGLRVGPQGTRDAGNPTVPDSASGKSDAGEQARQAFADELDAARQAAKDRRDILDDELRLHKISMDEWARQTVAALETEKAAIQKAAAELEASTALTSTEKLALLRRERDEVADIARQERDAQTKAAEASAQAWQKAIDSVVGVFNTAIKDMAAGHETLRQAAAKAFDGIAEASLRGVEKMISTWAAGLAAKKTMDLQAITGDAGRAAAGAYASASEVPVIGPILAPAAAAAAFAATEGLASADIGMWSVPQDMLTLVHHNELIMPAAEAGAFRAMVSGGGAGGPGGVSIHPTTNVHLSAIDGPSMASWWRSNGSDMMKGIDAAVRSGAALGTRRLRTL
ncbi:hypothetical protein [Roseiarcus fermentans]|nr:hypothetical protein [Roseiarcus fermentans]